MSHQTWHLNIYCRYPHTSLTQVLNPLKFLVDRLYRDLGTHVCSIARLIYTTQDKQTGTHALFMLMIDAIDIIVNLLSGLKRHFKFRVAPFYQPGLMISLMVITWKFWNALESIVR